MGYSDDSLDYLTINNYIEGVNDQFDIFGIQYKINDFWDFVELRKNNEIRKYANSFNKQIDNLTSNKKYDKASLFRSYIDLYYKLDKKQMTNKVAMNSITIHL